MDYEEYNICYETLKTWQSGISKEDNIQAKLACLEKFRVEGRSLDIHFLLPLLRDDYEVIRQRTAEVIAVLFDKLRSQNQLYESLKYLSIEIADVKFYSRAFPTDAAIRLLGIASVNKNGYVRHKALEMFAATKDPRAIRYLLLRLGDWVENVRQAATIFLQQFFTDEYRVAFIRELDAIEGLRKVGRVNLGTQYWQILDFILEEPLTLDWYKALSVSDKARLLYVKLYIEQKDTSRTLMSILLSDTNFLIRLQALRQLDRFGAGVILDFLNDPSSQVRKQALYHLKDKVPHYYDTVLALTSDVSASVRDLARYLLKPYALDFRPIYKDGIERGNRKVGSILGLAEVGTIDELELLKTQLRTGDPKVKLACLIALQRIDLQQAKTFALPLLTDQQGKIRKRCIEILRRAWDRDVMLETERIYADADITLKKMILQLYNSVGGWDVLSLLIRAVSEADSGTSDFAWHFLQRWQDKALRLFTRPPQEAIDKARTYYERSTIDSTAITPYRQVVWNEVQRYLRYS
jgi:HEAT repeat protein